MVDLWYRAMTPDAQFPEEVRRLVTSLLAALALRVRALNLGALLIRDGCDVLAEQLELYRRVRDRHARACGAARSALPLQARRG